MSCGLIESAERLITVEGGTRLRSVIVRAGSTLESCSGDSGGPWFAGTTALGIHSGDTGNGQRCLSLSGLPTNQREAHFTAIDETLNAFGAWIMTR